MKTTAKQTEAQKQTIQSKANKQAAESSILQKYKINATQLKSSEEEELLQGKFNTVQRKTTSKGQKTLNDAEKLRTHLSEKLDIKDKSHLTHGRNYNPQGDTPESILSNLLKPVHDSLVDKKKTEGEAEILQLKLKDKNTIHELNNKEEKTHQAKFNNTGLPDNLKSGIENLSGYSMDDVKVHYNSSQPATLQAHAYAQGTDIHLAPGQEKHLAHEAWHVVQQKQGRVKPTKQLKGTTNINDDIGLEKEADVMGSKALEKKDGEIRQVPIVNKTNVYQRVPWSQGVIDGKQTDVNWTYNSFGGSIVGTHMIANPLGPEHLQGGPPKSGVQKNLMNQLETDPHNSNENKYIRGHLLNDNVGGPGEDYNLFPITGNANKEHEQKIETHVKDWVNNKKQWVKYEVAVQHDSSDLSNDDVEDNFVNATFNCTASILDPAQGLKKVHTIAAAIKSEYQVGHNNKLKVVKSGNLADVGDEAQNYSPSLSTTKRINTLSEEDTNALQFLEDLFSNKKSANALKKELLSYEGIGKATVGQLENLNTEDDFESLDKKAKMAIKKILSLGGDELIAICGQIYEDQFGY